MSKINFSKGKFSKFISSKGFYLALAVCLVGAGSATWVAVNRTLTGIENANSQVLESENNFKDFPSLEETEKKELDVPKKYLPPSSSSSTPSSLSEPALKPEVSSEQPVASSIMPTLAYALPAKGTIISPYSHGELIKNVTLGDWRTHNGMDIALKKGEEVYAAADGVVIDIKADPLWGMMVTIKHGDNNDSIYCGLENTLPIKVGETISAKQTIGRLDYVPCEANDESHLHFAMKTDGAWIDPLSVIAKAK